MKHILALIVKFAATTIVLELVLRYLTRLSTFDILLISVAITAISYIIGDLAILPFSSNTVATIADLGLAFATIYVFNYIYRQGAIPIRAAILEPWQLLSWNGSIINSSSGQYFHRI